MPSAYERQEGDLVDGSLLTDATCTNMVTPEKIFWFSTVHVALITRYVRQAELVHGARTNRNEPVNVLDVGCNNGAAIRLYASSNFQTPNRRHVNYAGVDMNTRALEEARKNSPEGRGYVDRAVFLQADITRPWDWSPDGKFDIIWYTETIEHVPDYAAAWTLHEAWRVARPGAVMLLSTPAPLGDKLVWPESHDHEFTREEMRKMVADAGWTLEDEYGCSTNWQTGRRRLRELDLELFKQYELLRRRVGGTFARAFASALAPEVCDDLIYICRKEEH
jgi:2-polyprenyl-3-methyl-5-hydroxy-6-metoxy-1,4-benzoquinol methylase